MTARETALDSLAMRPADTCLLDLRCEVGAAGENGCSKGNDTETTERGPAGRRSWELTGEWPVVPQGLALVEV